MSISWNGRASAVRHERRDHDVAEARVVLLNRTLSAITAAHPGEEEGLRF
jgi:hypothetical protein